MSRRTAVGQADSLSNTNDNPCPDAHLVATHQSPYTGHISLVKFPFSSLGSRPLPRHGTHPQTWLGYLQVQGSTGATAVVSSQPYHRHPSPILIHSKRHDCKRGRHHLKFTALEDKAVRRTVRNRHTHLERHRSTHLVIDQLACHSKTAHSRVQCRIYAVVLNI